MNRGRETWEEFLETSKRNAHLIPGFLRGKFPQNSAQGRKAHSAFYCLLMQQGSGLSQYLGKEVAHALLTLFTPAKPVRLRISKAVRPKVNNEVQIAIFVHRYRDTHGWRGTWDSAVYAAAMHFGVSRAAVCRAWKRMGDAAKDLASLGLLRGDSSGARREKVKPPRGEKRSQKIIKR